MFLQTMFKDKAFWKSTLVLALPIALQNLLSSSLAIIDTIMVGQLGDIAIGAIGEASQVAFLINIFLFGLTAGGAVFAAQYWGKKDIAGIQRTYGLVLLCCIIISVLFSILISVFPKTVMSLYTNSEPIIALGAKYLRIAAFSYIGIAINLAFCTILRSVENVRLPVVSNIIAVSTNIFFNSVLIFGYLGFPKFGVEGAAIATVISSFINPFIIFTVSLFKRNILRCSIRNMFNFPKGFVRYFFKIALPVFFNEAMWVLGVTGTNMVFGRMGEANISALTVTRTIENIAFVLIIGLGNACGVLIGKNIGENKHELAKTYAKRFTIIVPTICLLIGAVIIVIRRPILSMFAMSDVARTTAMGLLVIYGLEMALRNLPYITIVGIFRPGGDTKTGVIYDMSCLWGLALPLTIVLGLILKWNFLTVYALMLICEDIPKSLLCIRHLLSGKWIKAIR